MVKKMAYYLGRMAEGKLTNEERKEYNAALKKQYEKDFGKRFHAKKKFSRRKRTMHRRRKR